MWLTKDAMPNMIWYLYLPVELMQPILVERSMDIRKSVNKLTITEKQQFVKAVKALKAKGIYDQYVRTHLAAASYPTPSTVSPSYRNQAHQGPAFAPWHRQYLRRFEIDLKAQVPGVTIPYWDWAADAALPNPATAPVWASDFMGGNGDPNNGYLVTTGSFAYNQGWVILDANGNSNGGGIRRQFGQQSSGLPPQSDVNAALAQIPYDQSPWDGSTTAGAAHRNMLEGWFQCCHSHNQVHLWIGQTMLLMTAPNDPVFFLLHSNVDRLWAQWQAQHPNAGYAPISGGPPGHNLNDPMFPWNTAVNGIVTPASVLNITALGYSYQ